MAASDVIASIKSTIVTNGVGAITASVLQAQLLAIVGLYAVALSGDVSGTLPAITINAGAVTAAKLAAGAAVGNLGFTPCNPASGCAVTGALTATTSASAPTVNASSALQGPSSTYAVLTATGGVQPAGSHMFCSDCLKPGQSAGPGTGMMEFSDGTAWFSMAGTAIAH